jgi:hypothetical protein
MHDLFMIGNPFLTVNIFLVESGSYTEFRHEYGTQIAQGPNQRFARSTSKSKRHPAKGIMKNAHSCARH